MRFTKTLGLFLTGLSALSAAGAAKPADVEEKGATKINGANNGKGGKDNGVDGANDGAVECTLNLMEPIAVQKVNATTGEVIEGDAEEGQATKVCIMNPEFEGGVAGIAYDLDEETFPYNFFADVEFSETVVTISSTSKKNKKPNHGGGTLQVGKGATLTKEKKPKQNNGKGNTRSLLRGNDETGADGAEKRRLSPTMGDVTLIVLYAVPPDAQNNVDAATLATDVFGLGVDPVSAKSQFAECSKDQVNYIPACAPGSFCENDPDIVNGVLQVPITQNIKGVSSGTVVNYVTAAANDILNAKGISLSDDFTKIMHVIPNAASWGGAAAWAYVPGTVSAFMDSYSKSMGVQIHEFGHNMGFGHSGNNGAGYADHSCLMGNPSYGDDGPQICFNGAKSWQAGWYASDSLSVDPAVGFSGELVGVADWVEDLYTPGQHKVVLEVIDTSISQNFYIIFNRKKGPNQGVTFAADTVTVTLGHGTSWHQASLGVPNPDDNYFPIFRKSNYNDGPKDLVIKSCGISLGNETTPGIASIKVYLDDGPGFNNGPMCPGEVPCINDAQCDDGNYCTSNKCDTTTNTCLAPEDISLTQCEGCGARSFCNPAGFCDPVCADTNPCTSDWCNADVCQHDPIAGCTKPGAILDSWYGIGGNAVSELTNLVKYQSNTPDESFGITTLDAPRNRASSFGARVSAYLVPPETGLYTFYVASDDASELFLSTDDNPANKALIASLSSWVPQEAFLQRTSQKSSPIYLEQGGIYYLEALYKEGGGGDHLSIAWESPENSIELGIIGEGYVFKYAPVPCVNDSQCDDGQPCTEDVCNADTSLCNFIPLDHCGDIAHLSDTVATLSTSCHGGEAARVIDGNYNTAWSGGSVAHTCDEDNAWVKLTFGATENLIRKVVIFNRGDCCFDRLGNSDIEVLDGSGNVIATEYIGAVSDGSPLTFDFDDVVASSILIKKRTYGSLNIAEIDVTGWAFPNSTLAPSISIAPSSSPTNLHSQAPSVSTAPTFGGYSAIDVSSVGVAGSTTRDFNALVIKGSGHDIWSKNDGFHFASYEQAYGDFDVSLHIEDFDGYDVHYWSKAGIMLRDSLATNSANYFIYLFGGRGVVSSYRQNAGQNTASTQGPYLPSYNVQFRMQKIGAAVTTYYRTDINSAWIQLGPTYNANFINPSGMSYIGIAVTSHDNCCLATVNAKDFELQTTPSGDLTRNIAHVGGATATQSTTCWSGAAERAIDGNYATWYNDGYTSHTCDESNAWLQVDLNADENVITSITLHNRKDCCWDRLSLADVDILDYQGNVVASQSTGTVTNGNPLSFNFDNVVGKSVRVRKTTQGTLQLVEVDIFGWQSAASSRE